MCTHTQKGYFLFSIELLVERFGQQSRKLRWFFAWPCQYTPGYNINTRGISAPLLSSQTQEVQCLSTSGEIALCIPIPHLVVPAHPGMWNDSELSQFSIFKAMYTHGSLRGRSDMKKIQFCLKDWKLRVNRIKTSEGEQRNWENPAPIPALCQGSETISTVPHSSSTVPGVGQFLLLSFSSHSCTQGYLSGLWPLGESLLWALSNPWCTPGVGMCFFQFPPGLSS